MRKFILALVSAIGLAGCVDNTRAPPSIAAMDHYDNCSAREPQFERMVECGKIRRQSYCTQAGGCSAEGNLIVQYGDSLVASYKRGEMSEAEARRRWVEFSMAHRNQQSMQAMQAMQAGAIMAATAPRTCFPIGRSISCF